ncbi:MAG: hypothetical protein ACRDOO_04820 [Actinomadura sp.]
MLSQALLAGVLYGALTLVFQVHDSIVVWSLATVAFAALYGAAFAVVAAVGRRRTRHGGDATG